jgi:hypothetical protein
MALYNASSPYHDSSIVNNQFLDIMVNRPIPKDPIDMYWEITQTYHLRPDLLAYDLYDNAGLWWVFAQRNPNRLKDPLFDFVAGTSIYLPQMANIKPALGL